MFSFRYLHRIHSTYSIIIRSYARRRINAKNPGIQKQIKALKDVPEKLIEDPEGFGDLETDFMNVHQSYKQYEKETAKHKENIRLWIIKNKYFKNKQPNFLMYAEKEQIKLLHERDPEEWSPEILTEKFPADLDTICKILKSKWTAKSKERILHHDQSVLKNWHLYKQGKLKLNDNLKEHLDKFVNRNDDEYMKMMKIDNLLPLKMINESKIINEFSNIITSCKQYTTDKTNNYDMLEDSNEKFTKENDENQQNELYENLKNKNQKCPGDDETYLMDKIKDKRYMRLEDVKKFKMNFKSNTITENVNELNELDTEEKIQENIDNNNQKEQENIDCSNDDEDNKQQQHLQIAQNSFRNLKKFESQEIVINQDDMKKYDVSTIKHRIYIPKKLWKKDATYKVKDCYYDYDGEFLYRIPGMTGNKV